jgi:hypothetical protein
MAISDDATGKDSVAPDDPLTLRNRALAATAEGVTLSDDASMVALEVLPDEREERS